MDERCIYLRIEQYPVRSATNIFIACSECLNPRFLADVCVDKLYLVGQLPGGPRWPQFLGKIPASVEFTSVEGYLQDQRARQIEFPDHKTEFGRKQSKLRKYFVYVFSGCWWRTDRSLSWSTIAPCWSFLGHEAACDGARSLKKDVFDVQLQVGRVVCLGRWTEAQLCSWQISVRIFEVEGNQMRTLQILSGEVSWCERDSSLEFPYWLTSLWPNLWRCQTSLQIRKRSVACKLISTVQTSLIVTP